MSVNFDPCCGSIITYRTLHLTVRMYNISVYSDTPIISGSCSDLKAHPGPASLHY
jgi:hypothetical protein